MKRRRSNALPSSRVFRYHRRFSACSLAFAQECGIGPERYSKAEWERMTAPTRDPLATGRYQTAALASGIGLLMVTC